MGLIMAHNRNSKTERIVVCIKPEVKEWLILIENEDLSKSSITNTCLLSSLNAMINNCQNLNDLKDILRREQDRYDKSNFFFSNLNNFFEKNKFKGGEE